MPDLREENLMIDSEKKFWKTAPSLRYYGDGRVVVSCGDCDWNNNVRDEPFVRAESKAEAMVLLGTHYLVTRRHKGIDASLVPEVTLEA